MSELPQVRPQRCINLCSKSMMVHGEAFENDPDFQAGLDAMWCIQTALRLGPDDGDVDLAACSDPNRSCYKEF
jgi:hypothetical protein